MRSNALPIMQGTEPKEGRKAWTGNWDFTQSQQFNQTIILTDIGMPSGIQSAFFDNSNSPALLIITLQGSTQKLVIPAYSQAILPILNVGSNFGITAQSAGNVAVPFQLFNFEQEASVINSQGTNVTGVVQVAGSVVTTPAAGAFVNRSGQVAAAGTSQQLAAANGARRRLLIVNPGSTAGQFANGSAGYNAGTLESLFIEFTAAAGVNDGHSVELLPGGSYDSGSGMVSTELINVTAPTAGHIYVAKEM